MTWTIRRRGGEVTTVEEAITIGQNPECTIPLDGPAVSPVHCRIRRSAGPLVLTDESSEGTRINGVRSDRLACIIHGDVIEIGEHHLTVEQVPRASSRPSEPGPTSIDLSFQVEAIESSLGSEHPRCYRDAVRLRAGCALLVMIDLVGDGTLDAGTRARWKSAIRAVGARSSNPDLVLRVLNAALFDAGLRATASCAVLDAYENILSLSSAGAPPPWIVRGGERIVRVQSVASIELGSLKGAAFAMRRLHFDSRDAFILPSAEWAVLLEATFAGTTALDGRPADWLRTRPNRPSDGCVLCMTLG